ncbi:MAG: type II secretion system F family protein, partial [Myxococcales bacterium]|nr:type II secretion system F family protein [Myxococcales bacterium]
KASPSIGESIRSTTNLVQAPFSEELDLLVKENKLGTPIDQAILNTSERIGSPIVSGALATLVIARQTGGDLPTILESSAGSLREMQRLEGVVKTKTAEGKGQVLVLGVMPFLMMGLLTWIERDWLKPLGEATIGFVIVAISATLWLVAIIWARNILDVDV